MAPAEMPFSYFVCNVTKLPSKIDAKSESLVGGKPKKEAFCKLIFQSSITTLPRLSRFLLTPTSVCPWPLEKVLLSSLPSSSPDHPRLSWQEKIMPFPLYIMNMPDEHDSQEYQSFKNIIRLLDLRQRKCFQFLNLLKLWPFYKPPAFRTQIPLKETPASCIAQHCPTYREWKRRQKLSLAEGREKPTKKPT